MISVKNSFRGRRWFHAASDLPPAFAIGGREKARHLAWVIVLTALLMGGVCSRAETGQPVWPPPPDEPRIAYLQSISHPSDAGSKVSGFRRFANWLSGAHQGDETLVRPFGLALDEADNLCVTDTGANAVCCFDAGSKRWQRWEEIGGVRFLAPVAVAKKGATLFVADSALPAVVAFNLDGKPVFRITEGLSRPVGLAISGDRLLVVDAASHCIVMFDLHGKPVGRFGSRGAGDGEFNYPTHVTTDAHGNIYVTDSLNSRVQVFNASGKFLRQIGRLGDSSGSLNRPKGVAVDAEGHVYVVDAMFANFQIFDADGRLLLDVGRPGSGPGEFWLPSGIAISHHGQIYVADTYNGRVQVFKYLAQK